jgi:hypothetical protein
MRRKALILATLAAALSASPAAANSDNSENTTAVTVGRTSALGGAVPTVSLSWGSAQTTIRVLTNASRGYRLTVTAVGISGTSTKLTDIVVRLVRVKGAGAAKGNTARAYRRTSQTGDVFNVIVQGGGLFGSGTVALRYKLEPLS